MRHRVSSPSIHAIILTGLLATGIGPLAGQTPAAPAADNTKVNANDRAKGAPTAEQQKENAADRALAQKVRKALIQDKTLSTYAHNVKVIVRDGQITLKGPVRSEDEKRRVETKATELAGTGHVTNQISVAPIHPKTSTTAKTTTTK